MRKPRLLFSSKKFLIFIISIIFYFNFPGVFEDCVINKHRHRPLPSIIVSSQSKITMVAPKHTAWFIPVGLAPPVTLSRAENLDTVEGKRICGQLLVQPVSCSWPTVQPQGRVRLDRCLVSDYEQAVLKSRKAGMLFEATACE